jgi:ATP-dependent Lon protease
MPLFIFEERYRLMLEHALEGNRMFCIGSKVGSEDDDILPWSTAGLIRACVRQPDGTSHLMLNGMRRIAITGWTQEKPFRIASVEPIPTEPIPPSAGKALINEALDLLPEPTATSSDAMQKLKETMASLASADLVADILSYHFVRDPEAIRLLLKESSTERRYQVLLSELRRL